jgi:putative peptidoglycan lipid II flippase
MTIAARWRAAGLVFLLTVPSSAGLIVLGDSMIGAIYQGGKFQAYDTGQTALALSCYAIGLAGYAAIKVLAPAFYALGDSRTPMYVSLASIATNFVVASVMIHVAGLGLPAALSTSARQSPGL